MSVVPYNTSNRIIYRYPGHGVVVVHNKVDNTLQLITQNNGDHLGILSLDKSKHRNGNNNNNTFQHEESYAKCPNCGFLWLSGQFPTSNGTNSNNTTSKGGGKGGGEDNEFSNTPPILAGGSNGLFEQEFMHQDYFKLLSRLPASSSPSSSSIVDEIKVKTPKGLPDQIFNQDYFKRFFKKVPPYELGSGAHAQVYKVVHVLNNIPLGTYAVKRISIGDKIEFLEQVLKEVLILYELSLKGANENNLIRYNHVWLELGDLLDLKAFVLPANESSAPPEFHNKVPYVFILQQYCDGGDLEGIIKNNFPSDSYASYRDKVERERMKRRLRKRQINDTDNSPSWLNALEIWKFFKDVITGVNYLHIHGILHRDLKPSNCLLEAKYEINSCSTVFESLEDLLNELEKIPKVLVSDFGEGKFTDKHSITESDTALLSIHENRERKGNTGTLEFTAPELWMLSVYDPANHKSDEQQNRFTHDFTYESDIYLLGMILCWLCLGELPFSASIENEQDPEASRIQIINWYKQLTQSQFLEWFAHHRKISGEIIDDFACLIFSMIKGHDLVSEDHKRILLPDVAGLMDEFKFKYFIPRTTQNLSDHTISVTANDPSINNINSDDKDTLSICDADALELLVTSDDAFEPQLHETKVNSIPENVATDLVGLYVSILALVAAMGTFDTQKNTCLYVILAVLMCLLVDTYFLQLWRYRLWLLVVSFLIVILVGLNVIVFNYNL